MKLFDVYPLLPFETVRGQDSWIWDSQGNKYLDLYGGHAVISIGHQHPRKWTHWKRSWINWLSIQTPFRILYKKARWETWPSFRLHNYNLFLVNSGAEANENALKLASSLLQEEKRWLPSVSHFMAEHRELLLLPTIPNQRTFQQRAWSCFHSAEWCSCFRCRFG